MHWYLLHTKPKQEACALQNLEQQGYQCYLPTVSCEKLRQGVLAVADEPLFPRYLFVRLGVGEGGKSWAPIRSTRGVSRLVTFGSEPAKVDDALIETLRAQALAKHSLPERLFKPGERVCLSGGAFSGIEGVYQMTEGESRVMVLIELLSKPVVVRLAPACLRKVV